ncbi:hypothetical protein CPC08DRAFT_24483 [Agrocybe pediades]|nr:hypothetical protein CPC08DRAFT_24483 [Agrocybe pediades]
MNQVSFFCYLFCFWVLLSLCLLLLPIYLFLIWLFTSLRPICTDMSSVHSQIHRPLPPPDMHPQGLKPQGLKLKYEDTSSTAIGMIVAMALSSTSQFHIFGLSIWQAHSSLPYPPRPQPFASPAVTTTVTQALTAPATMILAGVQGKVQLRELLSTPPSPLIFRPILGHCLRVSTFDTSKQRTGVRAISRHTGC